MVLPHQNNWLCFYRFSLFGFEQRRGGIACFFFGARQRVDFMNLKTTNYVDIIFKNSKGEPTLSKNTTLSRGEAVLVLDELQAVIQNSLLDGYSVQMGDWDSFQLTFNCIDTDTEAECTADKITSVNIRSRPGKQMKEALPNAKVISLKDHPFRNLLLMIIQVRYCIKTILTIAMTRSILT